MFNLLLAGRQQAFRHLTVNPLKLHISRSLYTLNKEETEEAKRWLEKIRLRPLQRSDVELTFARSSGPGGQNVNKVNTKAVAKCPIDSPLIPSWARDNLKSSNAYISTTRSLQVSSTATRSQAQNVEDCLKKLHALLLDTVTSSIRNEPSEAQSKHVVRLMHADRERNKVNKAKRRDVKSGRSRVMAGGE